MSKRILLFLRFFLILTTILVMTYSRKGLRFPDPGYIIAFIYFVSNLLLYRVSERYFSKPAISFLVFFFDIVTISLAIYFTQGFETDFYLIYFLAIFIASVSQDIGGSLPIAVVASIFYGWMVYRASPGVSLLDSRILIRVPFLFIISLIGTYWAHATRAEIRKKEELEHFNRELKKEVDKVVSEEIQLRKYTERIIDSVPSGVIATRQDGIITTLNPEAERVLSVEKGELIGYNIKNIQGLAPFWHKMEQAIKSGTAVKRDEVVIQNRLGSSIPLGFSISPIPDTSEMFSGCVVIFVDLSEKRSLEEQLKQAERLSYLGKMASWVAHEIRNPLTSIDGFAQLLDSAPKSNKLPLYSSEIRKGTERIDHIIDDILSFARAKRNIDPVEINLRELIDSITRGIMNIKISIEGIDNPVIRGELDSVRRVFINLVNNSIEAMKDGGSLQIRFSSNKNWIIAEVQDNGGGIPDENIKNLFTPFFTTKQRGTGLGLSIIKKIIDEHNGRIEIESKEGSGTTARVYFPKN